jgi:predicted TIM-barrel fold metal-dependent hydrolase
MFGSDYPFIEPKAAIRKVLRLDLSEDDKERILWKNAVRILNP